MKRKNPFVKRPSIEYDLCVLEFDHYELECYFFFDSSEPLLYVWDSKNSVYNVVGDFFRFRWDAGDIYEDLIPDLKNLLASGRGNEVFASELVSSFVEPKTTYFSAMNDLSNVKKETKDQTQAVIETESFLKIAKLWYYFLVLANHRKIENDADCSTSPAGR